VTLARRLSWEGRRFLRRSRLLVSLSEGQHAFRWARVRVWRAQVECGPRRHWVQALGWVAVRERGVEMEPNLD